MLIRKYTVTGQALSRALGWQLPFWHMFVRYSGSRLHSWGWGTNGEEESPRLGHQDLLTCQQALRGFSSEILLWTGPLKAGPSGHSLPRGS